MNTDIIKLIDKLGDEQFIPSVDKQTLYDIYHSEHITELDKYSTDDGQKTKYLISQLDEAEKQLYSAKNQLYRKAIEINIDILRDYIELMLIQNIPDSILDRDAFKYYPEITDSAFNTKLFNKQEFQNTSLKLLTKHVPDTTNFKLSNSQKFVKHFMSGNTPYNGILLWHEVGVGKTCAGITIAENYRNKMFANDKKILILTPSETLQQNWRDEIFNIEKELHNKSSDTPGQVQCTANTYSDVFAHLTNDNKDAVKRKSKKFIEQYYQFWSYQKLAKNISVSLKQQAFGKLNNTRATIDYIKKVYSNRLIIMDEIHVTRETDESSTHKDAVKYIELIARYAENTKFVLLTATPMYNISSEIVWLLNILLLNDKRAPIRTTDIFTDDGIKIIEDPDDSVEGELYVETPQMRLIRASRGYVSYVRGTNPNTFPIKLEPNDSDTYIPAPLYHILAGRIVPSDEDKVYLPIENMKFYRNTTSQFQWNKIKSIILWADGDDTVEKTTGFSQRQARACNIVFPSSTEDTDVGEIADAGFDGCFTLKRAVGKYTFKVPGNSKRFKNNKNFLHLENISVYSKKIHNIIRSCTLNKGIGFIFSQYLKSGTTIMAMALEQNGFTRYKGTHNDDNLIEPGLDIGDKFCAKHCKYYRELTPVEQKTFIPARYILLDGSTPKPLLNTLIKECRGEGEHPNINGEHIKIIIGSRVTEQGLSLHRVREVHIMDPWFHLNQMEQAVGRAVRNFSHMKLPENKRNVTIFLHTASLPTGQLDTNNIETPDERVYRLAYNKRIHMAKIERILKKNAVDCRFNMLGNIYSNNFYSDVEDHENPLANRTIMDSRGKHKDINLYDTDGDKQCDFESCDYKCFYDGQNDTIEPPSEINNSDTYSSEYAMYDIQYAEEHIKELFTEEFAFEEEDIIETVQDIITGISIEHIYMALDHLIHMKVTVLDKYNREGYLINRGRYYIFQPHSFENVAVPMLYRYISNFSVPGEYTLKALSTKDTTMSDTLRDISSIGERSVEINYNIKWEAIKAHLTNTKDVDILKINTMFVVKLLETSPNKKYIVEELYIMFIINLLETGQMFGRSDHHSNKKDMFPLTSTYRMNILKVILEKHLNSVTLDQYDNIVFNYYNKQHGIAVILRDSNISGETGVVDDVIRGFRFIEYREGLYKEYIYIYDPESKTLVDQTSAYRARTPTISFKASDIIDNKSNIYGYPGTNVDYPKKTDTPLVVVIKPPGITKTSKKTMKRGGVCGTVAGASNTKTDMPGFIYDILEKAPDIYSKFIAYPGNTDMYKMSPNPSDTRKIKDTIIKMTKMNPDTRYTKANICLDISILLRYIDIYSDTTSASNRTYYSYEERLLHKKIATESKL